ncbi:4-hydroxy-3-methylbut-2-enyl diphosphate reductase [Candidatus Marinamargulisbacteria bacterium SCGC AG-343-K17]|nr:4-hydroxy-3-methylbut-2-enyl diphosphate reductase [Candidatus Marinamargulisbacteria bacterium SCGC AG-343-K17]
MSVKELHLAHTQGFCAGVVNAIDIVELSIQKFGVPLYVRHAIVHNTSVIKDFESRGVIFIETLSDVPNDQVVVFSAHGTAPDVYTEAQERNLTIVDATCPLVTKVHRQARRYSERGIHIILIGHRGHQELIGTSGYIDKDLLHIVEDQHDIDALSIPSNVEVGVLTQTTLSVDDTSQLIDQLRLKFPNLITGGKEDICYATQNRQDAVKALAKKCELIIVIGSSNSSNSNRLVETSKLMGVESFIIDLPEEIDYSVLNQFESVGVTSGASVPSYLIDRLVKAIKKRHPDVVIFQEDTIEKDILFPLPKEVADMRPA